MTHSCGLNANRKITRASRRRYAGKLCPMYSHSPLYSVTYYVGRVEGEASVPRVTLPNETTSVFSIQYMQVLQYTTRNNKKNVRKNTNTYSTSIRYTEQNVRNVYLRFVLSDVCCVCARVVVLGVSFLPLFSFAFFPYIISHSRDTRFPVLYPVSWLNTLTKQTFLPSAYVRLSVVCSTYV